MSGVMLVSTSEPMVLALNTATGVGNTKEVTCQPPECKAPSSTDDGVMSLKSSVTEPMLRGGITGTPTAAREFKPGDEIVLVAEAYENRRRSNKPSVITLTTELRGTDGQVVPLGSEQQRVTALRNDVFGSAFRSYVSIPAVPDGTYVMRAEARSNVDESRGVIREVSIVVRR